MACSALLRPAFSFFIFFFSSSNSSSPSPFLKRMTEVGGFNPLPYQGPAAAVVAAGIFLVAAAAASTVAALPLMLFQLRLFFQLLLQLLFQLLLLLFFLLLLPFPPLPLFLLLSLLLFLWDTLLERGGVTAFCPFLAIFFHSSSPSKALPEFSSSTALPPFSLLLSDEAVTPFSYRGTP